jgi:hypothetical protein
MSQLELSRLQWYKTENASSNQNQLELERKQKKTLD